MNKPLPYQPTLNQMQAQSQAQRLIQQQAYIQAAQNQQITQAQLQQAQMAQQAGGVQYVGHWSSNQTASCSATNTAYIAYLGADGTVYYTTLQGTGGTATVSVASQGAGGGGVGMAERPVLNIEECGVRAGEIIAYRAWKLSKSDERLRSMFVGYIWEPDEPQKIGDKLNPYHGNGFHAFKTLAKCKQEYPYISPVTSPMVYGEVALWGEVIEHEKGYRAECARVTRILEVHTGPIGAVRRIFQPSPIKTLRRLYGVQE